MKKVLLHLCICLLFFILCVPSSILAQCDGRYETNGMFSEVDATFDIQYGSSIQNDGSEKTLLLNFYEPAIDEADKRPLIIWAHGGSFINGDHHDGAVASLCQHFSELGYVNASINYRLASLAEALPLIINGGIEEFMADELIKAIHDMKAAIRFFRKDAAEDNLYKIDTDQIFVGGISAGAILATNLAYLDTNDGFEAYKDFSSLDIQQIIDNNGGFEGESGNPGYPTHINGVINLSGAVAHTMLIEPGEEPIVSVHDTDDFVVPYGRDSVVLEGFNIIQLDGSGQMKPALDSLGLTNDLLAFEENAHVGYLGADKFEQVADFIRDFLFPLLDCNITSTGDLMNGSIRVYPNPAQDVLSIDIDQAVNNWQLKVINALGQTVLSRNEVNSFTTIDSGVLPAGLYFIETNIEGIKERTKVILK